jgi:hypothetical protein
MPYVSTRRAVLSRLWTPADLGSALSLWLNANDPTTITLSGSNVTSWTDKSVNTNTVAQATGANQPTLVTTGSAKYVNFTGSPQILIGNAATPNSFPLLSADRSCFSLVNPSASIASGAILEYGNGAASFQVGNGFMLFQSAANSLDMTSNGFDVKTSSAITASPQIVCARYAGPKWTPVFAYTPSGGPISASAAPGSIPGFSDINGNSWSIDSSNNLRQVATSSSPHFNNGLFLLGGSNAMVDSRIDVVTTQNGADNLLLMARVTSATAGHLTAYMASFNNNGSVTFYRTSSTTLTSLGTGPTGTSISSGQYVCSFFVTQTSATLSTLTATTSTMSGVVVNSFSTSDSTGPQNSSGGQGIAINGTLSGSLQSVTTYTDVGGTPSGHISINATSGVTGVTGVTTVQSGALHIGGAAWNGTTQNYYLGGISQIIMVNGDASTRTTALCEGYLAWSSGLVSLLPSTHAYKLAPPRIAG